ncbi:MAG: sugar ABC transporter permease [Bacilli bacterium]|nr:sugar ABC transporter permease [Bacilli bacterium]
MTKLTRKRREELAGWALISPQVLGFLAFVAFPLVFSIILCFCEWNYIDMPTPVGLKNFERCFNDDVFWRSILNTLIYIGLVVPSTLVLSLTLAMMTNRKLPMKKIYRAAFFLPMVTSTIAIGTVWAFIFQTNGGVLNTILGFFGVNALDWFNNEVLARIAVAIVSTWLKVGYYYIIFDAGLKNIPKDLYEAADVEGANWWQKFLKITLPMLSSVTFFVVVMLFIDVFNMFNEVYIMTAGGPNYSTFTLSMYIFYYAFNQSDMGRAAVASWVLFMLVGIITAIEFFVKKKVVYE